MPVFFERRSFSHSASSSFGVVNMHLMSSCALQERQRLVDDVLLVGLELLHLPLLDQLDDPARIEIDAEADAAAVLGEVLDRQPQPARARRAEHQPVGALRESSSGSVSLNIS